MNIQFQNNPGAVRGFLAAKHCHPKSNQVMKDAVREVSADDSMVSSLGPVLDREINKYAAGRDKTTAPKGPIGRAATAPTPGTHPILDGFLALLENPTIDAIILALLGIAVPSPTPAPSPSPTPTA